jgi:lipopolysaccharide assembly outer membrane protein LptD (OstA)
MQLRTTIFEKVNISANSSFSLYGLDSNGRTIGTFLYAQNKKLMRLTNFTTSLNFSLSELIGGKNDRRLTNAPQSGYDQEIQEDENMTGAGVSGRQDSDVGLIDEYGYPVFDVPWSLNLSYSLNYSKAAFTPKISQTLSFNGNVTITKKMSLTFTSGYDFTGKQITMTQIGMTRDLHCWEMNFNWVPNGTLKSWNFTIRVKASVLADLKYERRKDFHDSY